MHPALQLHQCIAKVINFNNYSQNVCRKKSLLEYGKY